MLFLLDFSSQKLTQPLSLSLHFYYFFFHFNIQIRLQLLTTNVFVELIKGLNVRMLYLQKPDLRPWIIFFE